MAMRCFIKLEKKKNFWSLLHFCAIWILITNGNVANECDTVPTVLVESYVDNVTWSTVMHWGRFLYIVTSFFKMQSAEVPLEGALGPPHPRPNPSLPPPGWFMTAWSGFTVIESSKEWEIDSKAGSSLMAPLFYLLSSETCFRQLWQWHPALIAPSQVMSRDNSHRKLERRVLWLCRMSAWDKVGSGWGEKLLSRIKFTLGGFWMRSLKHLGIEGM